MSSWVCPSSGPALDQLEVEVGRTLEDRVQPGLTGDHGESVTWTRSTRPAAISARFIDRLPCERNGTSDYGEDQDDDRDPGHGEAEGPVRVERAGPAGHVVVSEAEHAEAGQEDLDAPGRQEGEQHPAVAGQRGAAQPVRLGAAGRMIPGVAHAGDARTRRQPAKSCPPQRWVR
jgi:hypothetical protein